MDIKFTIKDKEKPFRIPEYATRGSSGMDLYSSNIEDILIQPGEVKLVDTNICIEIPYGTEAQIRSRSGLALKNQIFVLNSPGTIDCFSKSMKIKTIDGDKYVKDLSIDDVILSYNLDSNDIEKDSIKVIIDKGILNIIEIEMENGNILEISEDTLVYTNNGIKNAKDLMQNDEIFIFN